MLQKLKYVGAALFLLLIGGTLAGAYAYGNGKVTLVAPPGGPVEVREGDKVLGTVPAGGHLELTVSQGKHALKLIHRGNTTEQPIDVASGMYAQLLPVGKQCFAVLDVTNYWYKKKRLLDRLSREVTVEARYAEGKPLDMPTGVYFSTEELPLSIKEKQRTRLLLQLPCEAVAGTDAALITAALGRPSAK